MIKGCEPLHPPVEGDVVDVDPALGQELLEIAVGQAVAEVPAHRQEDHLRRELEPRECRAPMADRTNRAVMLHPISLPRRERPPAAAPCCRGRPRCNSALDGDPVPDATRVVSLHDRDARPIVKGWLGRPVEFGYLAQVLDNRDGIVVDHGVHIGNPPDAPLLAPAIARIKARFGRAPRAVAANRGYGEAAVDSALAAVGARRVAIPRRGRPSAARQQIERARPFRHLVKWRTGIEGRISHLKHGYGWAAPTSTPSPVPECGAGWACSPTTRSRSPRASRTTTSVPTGRRASRLVRP